MTKDRRHTCSQWRWKKGTVIAYSFFIEVFSEPPMIVDPPMDTNATIGQQVTLRCFAKGYPVPDVFWLFEGTRIPRRNTRYTVRGFISFLVTEHSPWPITGLKAIRTIASSKNETLQISDNNVELTIEKVTRHDSGTFTCSAVNTVGSAVATANLLVGVELTGKVDKLLDDSTIEKIAKQAKEKVERWESTINVSADCKSFSALASTKDQRKIDKIESPHDLRKLFKFAISLKKVDLGKAREIYEESIRLVQMHIDNGINLRIWKTKKWEILFRSGFRSCRHLPECLLWSSSACILRADSYGKVWLSDRTVRGELWRLLFLLEVQVSFGQDVDRDDRKKRHSFEKKRIVADHMTDSATTTNTRCGESLRWLSWDCCHQDMKTDSIRQMAGKRGSSITVMNCQMLERCQGCLLERMRSHLIATWVQWPCNGDSSLVRNNNWYSGH